MPSGYERLRVQIARRAIMAGISAGPDDVLITSGCVETVLLALRVESPFYFNFLQMIAAEHSFPMPSFATSRREPA